MRTQSISPLSEEQEWLAEPIDPSGWLTGTPRTGARRGAQTQPGGQQPAEGDEPVPGEKLRRRAGRMGRSAQLGGARVTSSRRRQRLPSRSVREYANGQASEPLVVDQEPVAEGYRMGRWARLALTLTVLATAAVLIAAMVAGPAPHTLVDVTVGPGDSLWSIASEAAPDSDPRVVIEEIRQLNGISDDVLPIGVVLRVPASSE